MQIQEYLQLIWLLFKRWDKDFKQKCAKVKIRHDDQKFEQFQKALGKEHQKNFKVIWNQFYYLFAVAYVSCYFTL